MGTLYLEFRVHGFGLLGNMGRYSIYYRGCIRIIFPFSLGCGVEGRLVGSRDIEGVGMEGQLQSEPHPGSRSRHLKPPMNFKSIEGSALRLQGLLVW